MKQQAAKDAFEGFQDRYDQEKIRARRSRGEFGRILAYRERVTSTNDVILDMAASGAPHGAVCLADEQTAGRGRRGYGWFSPPGCGIWASFLLRPRLPAAGTPPLTLCTAGAVAKALESVTDLAVRIKWPNDLLIANRKVAGLLAESRVLSADEPVIVVGMGINVNQTREMFPAEISARATSLRIESGGPLSRQELFLSILDSFESTYLDYLKAGPVPLLGAVDARLAWRGRMVEADSPAGTIGRLSRVDEEGGLVLERDGRGPVVIRSGSIRLRPGL